MRRRIWQRILTVPRYRVRPTEQWLARQGDYKARPFSPAVAAGLDGTTVSFDHLLYDRETKSDAVRGIGPALLKSVEDIRQQLRIDPFACIGDSQPDG